jgi:uncharacterized protein YhhL (DUF1145 family)
MSIGKIVLLAIYAALAALVVALPGTMAASVAYWIIVVLVVVHLLEVIVFFRLAQRAGGSLPLHLLQVFFFGILHKPEMEAAAARQ